MTRRVRGLPWAPHVAIAASVVGLAGANWTGVGWRVPLIGATAAAVVTVLAGRRGRTGIAVAAGVVSLVLLGLGWGSARLGATTTVALSDVRTVEVEVLVETTGVPAGDVVRQRVRVMRTLVPAAAVPTGTRLFAELSRNDVAPATGSLVRLVGSVRPAARFGDPGWWRRYLARQAVAGAVRVRRLEVIGRRGGIAGMRDTVRIALGAAAGRGLTGDQQTLVRGMALGGGGALSAPVADDMRRAGIWHLLAVSGQNIAYVVLAIEWLVDVLGLRRRPGKVVALACVIVYLLACDGGASVWRAGIVGCLVLVGDLVDRERDRGYLLLVGLAVLLAMQPRAIADPGLQLSFAAVAGLLILGPTLRTWMLGFFDSRGAEYVASSIAATLATAPITIANFGTMSLVGVGVNVVVAPLAGPVVIAALVGAVVGVANPTLGQLPTLVAGWGASLIADIAHVAAAVPGASRSMAWLGTAATVGAVVAIPVMRWWLWSPTAQLRSPMRPRMLALALTPAALVQGLVIAMRHTPDWPSVATLTVLDVGQGDAIVLRSPEGGALLVDTGPDGAPARVVGQLRRFGVRRLSAVLVTHDQTDHDGALPAVVESMPGAVVYAPQAADVATTLRARLGRAVRPLAAGDQLRVGQWTVDVLWPPPSLPKGPANDGALVVRATCPSFAVLLGADAEGAVLRRLTIGRVDVLKVSHHGSDDPDLAQVLSSIKPSLAVISVGAGNSFGHPTAGTLATLGRFGVDVRRTDRDGPVTVQSGVEGLRIASGR